jgi:hypothetical protein
MAEAFKCPTCSAEYQLVRVETDRQTKDHELACISRGGPLNGREGRLILKYFYVDRRSKKRKAIGPVKGPS